MASDTLRLADGAAAPSVSYADWVHPIADAFATVRAYRQPSEVRAHAPLAWYGLH